MYLESKNNVNALNVWARLFCSAEILHHLNDINSRKKKIKLFKSFFFESLL